MRLLRAYLNASSLVPQFCISIEFIQNIVDLFLRERYFNSSPLGFSRISFTIFDWYERRRCIDPEERLCECFGLPLSTNLWIFVFDPSVGFRTDAGQELDHHQLLQLKTMIGVCNIRLKEWDSLYGGAVIVRRCGSKAALGNTTPDPKPLLLAMLEFLD